MNPEENKPFWKTSEFGMSVTAIAMSIVLVVFGRLLDDSQFIEMGKAVMQAAVGGYILSRGMAKR